ncbi:MAG: peroxiredoxin [Blastocatellia bacterium]
MAENRIKLEWQPVRVGSESPDFILKNETGGDWRLADHRGNVVVLLFYPRNETLVCTKQLCAVRDHWGKYIETKAEIVGISPAEPADHAAFAEKYSLPIPLLADPERAVTTNTASILSFRSILLEPS